jgi:hypothetical protein
MADSRWTALNSNGNRMQQASVRLRTGVPQIVLCRTQDVESNAASNRVYLNATDLATCIKVFAKKHGTQEIIDALTQG